MSFLTTVTMIIFQTHFCGECCQKAFHSFSGLKLQNKAVQNTCHTILQLERKKRIFFIIPRTVPEAQMDEAFLWEMADDIEAF